MSRLVFQPWQVQNKLKVVIKLEFKSLESLLKLITYGNYSSISETRPRFLNTCVQCRLIMGMYNCVINQLLTLNFCTHLKMCPYKMVNVYAYS